jgi:Ca-activated chloride channel homolog
MKFRAIRPFILPALALAALCAAPLAAQSASITQIDSSRLMAFQKNRIYAHVLDSQGKVMESADSQGLEVYESADGQNYTLAGKPKLVTAPNRDQGISFLFLVDDSGSMYDTIDGKSTDDPAASRAKAANKAASDFLNSITSSKDAVGIAAFNTRYALLQEPVRDLQKSGQALDRISKPAKEEGYTELYGSLVMAARDMGALKGRKALVVLSDGENFPYYEKLGKENPEFGKKTYAAAESLDEAIRQGVTIFAVNYGPEVKDSRLAELARKSGGEVFDARNSEELSRIYTTIREKILTEVLVEYSAKMFSGDKRWVKLGFGKAPGGPETARYYYSGTVFGKPYKSVSLWVLLLIPLALLALFILSRIKFEKPSSSANLSLLYGGGAGKGTKMFAVGEKTVIGSDARADITIANNTRLESSPVTIVKDKTSGRYTIVSEEPLTVNNRTVTKKNLEPGDVINFNGTIAVFDDIQDELDLDPAKKTTHSARTWDKTAPRKRKG